MDHIGSDPRAGCLLVATPLLGDPNFKRTVVLIVEHEEEQGTLGVVLNRPTEVGVGQVLEQWTDLATEPSVVFRGGPVSTNSAIALALIPGKEEPAGWGGPGRRPVPGPAGPARPGHAAGAARHRDHRPAGVRGLRGLVPGSARGGNR